jgi:uncharacterized protein
MKIVVAGGSGLIGTAITDALAQAGHDVVILSRDDRGSRTSYAPVVAWTPGRQGPWAAELDGADAVINLAGESLGRWPWTARRRRALRESRIVATRSIVDAIAALPPARRPRVLVNASGTDLYEGRDAIPADESTPPADTFLSHLCIDWEAEAHRAEPLGVRVVLFRMSVVVAPGASSLRILMLPFRLFVGGRVGSGKQWMSWVSIDDVVGLALTVLESAAFEGPVNVAAPDPRPQSEFATAIGRAIHRPSWFPTPAWVVRLVLGEQSTLALGSRRVWPAKALAAGYEFRTPRLERALKRAVQ